MITVTDVDDNPPSFSSSSYSANMNENPTIGVTIPALDIVVTDDDVVRNLHNSNHNIR